MNRGSMTQDVHKTPPAAAWHRRGLARPRSIGAAQSKNFAVAVLQPIKCKILRARAKHSHSLRSAQRVSKDERNCCPWPSFETPRFSAAPQDEDELAVGWLPPPCTDPAIHRINHA